MNSMTGQNCRVRWLVESANDDTPYGEDGNPQLAILMNEGVPEIGLRNRRPALIPSDDRTADLCIQRVKAPDDLHRLGASNRVAVNIMIDVVHTALRKKLSRTVARRSPFPIVEHDLDHDSSTLGLFALTMRLRALGFTLGPLAPDGHRLSSPEATNRRLMRKTARQQTSCDAAMSTRLCPPKWRSGSSPRSFAPGKRYTRRN
jgi:hypothetical protein